jgi:hypothetical protein
MRSRVALLFHKMIPSSLTGSNLRTYKAFFRNPAPRNLAWRNVLALLGELGKVTNESNGHLRVTRHGHTLVLHSPQSKEVSEQSTVKELRHFLERSEKPAPSTDEAARHWLVVIDHHEARIFRSVVQGKVPLQVLPHAPEAYFRHAAHSKDFSRGREKPDPSSYFGPIAAALGETGKVLVFGCGKGTGSEMEQFLTWVKSHHPALAARIIGMVSVDEHHLTEAQLLAQGREFYLQLSPSLLR